MKSSHTLSQLRRLEIKSRKHLSLLLIVGGFILSWAASESNLEAQVAPFTVNPASTLTFTSNPNASYSIATTYYTDDANTYTVTLTPTTAVSVSTSATVPLFSVGDGGTGASDVNNFTINANTTLASTGAITSALGTVNFNGNASGSNAGTLTSSQTYALTVAGNLSLTNSGTITDSTAYYAISVAGNISSLTNQAGGLISGGVYDAGTIATLTNSGTINGGTAIHGAGITTLTNNNTISGSNYGIYDAGATALTSLTNNGTISGGKDGLEMLGASIGTLTNNQGKTISGTGSNASGVFSNNTIADLENYGTISGGGSSVGLFAGSLTTLNNYSTGIISGGGGMNVGGDIGTVVNDGLIQGTSLYGLDAIYSSSITNNGTIEGAEDGVSSTTLVTLINSSTGIINGGAGDGVYSNNITTLNNAGTITNTSGSSYGVYSANTIGSLINSGTISGHGNSGIYSGDYANITLNNGTVSGGGGTDAIQINAVSNTTENPNTNADNSTVVINGSAHLTGAVVETNGIGKITLNLIGLDSTSQAYLRSRVGLSSGDFTDPLDGTYDWSGLVLQAGNFGSSNNVASFLAVSVDPGLQSLAKSIDTNGLPAGPQFTTFVTAATTNPEAAIQSLSGRVIDEGIQNFKVEINNGLVSQLDAQLDNLQDGPIGGIDLGNLNIGTDQMLAYNNTDEQLNNLVGIATMSDVAGTEMSIPPVKPDVYKWGVWVKGTVSLASEDQRGAQAGYHALYGTPTVGVSYRINPSLTVGALANYTTAGADFSDGSKIDVDEEMVGAFAAWQKNAWQIHALAAGGISQYKDQRATLDGSTAYSSPGGTDVLADLTGGHEFNLIDGYKITPQLGVQYANIYKNSTSESGSDLDLNVGSQNINSLRSHLGFNLTRSFQIDDKLQFVPEFHAAWYHEYLDGNSGVNTSLQSAPVLGSFAVTSVNSPERDYALLGVGLDAAFTGYKLPIGLFLNYDVQAGQASYIQNNISAGVRVAF